MRQVGRVLDLLEFFATQKRAATLAEISKCFGWPRSSTFNLLGLLVDRGFLYEPNARAGFYPTPRWSSLVQQITNAQPVPEDVQAVLRDVAALTGETTVIAAPGGVSAVFLAAVESPHAIRYSGHVGKAIPIHATATGLALLSLFPERQRLALLKQVVFEQFTPATLMTVDAVEAEIRSCVERGWFPSMERYSRDLGGVAIPLRVADRQLAILVAGPLFRLGGRYEDLATLMQAAIGRHLKARPLTATTGNGVTD